MPNKIGRKDFRPRHMEVLEIPIDPRTGKKADWVGINRGKQENRRLILAKSSHSLL